MCDYTLIMSDQNPFKSKPINSRFSKDIFFSDDEIKNKEKHTERKKNIEHSSSNVNTFLVDKEKTFRTTNSTHKIYGQERNNYRKQDKQLNEITPVSFNITIEEFPELSSPSTSVSNMNINVFKNQFEGKNFLDAVNTVNIVEEENDKIKPGWIVICKDNNDNQIKIIEGELTQYQVNKKEKDILQDNPNFIMKEIHEELCKIWEKNIALYDCIHGEGAYEEIYYLPPIYDDFYKYDDSESEEDDEIDVNDMDEYSDRGWTSDYE